MDRDTFDDLSWSVTEKYDEGKHRFAEFGLCGRCKDFKYRKTKLMNGQVWCDAYQQSSPKSSLMQPNNRDPITECSDFYPKGQLDLAQMNKIAMYIDPKQRKMGFGTSDTELVVTPPGKKED
jgi:hypothetical protein